jgi:hypothetical protein
LGAFAALVAVGTFLSVGPPSAALIGEAPFTSFEWGSLSSDDVFAGTPTVAQVFLDFFPVKIFSGPLLTGGGLTLLDAYFLDEETFVGPLLTGGAVTPLTIVELFDDDIF